MSHDHATVAEEEYLQTIFWLQEAGLPMTGANVARASSSPIPREAPVTSALVVASIRTGPEDMLRNHVA